MREREWGKGREWGRKRRKWQQFVMKDDSEDCFDSISIGIKQTQNSNLAIYEAIQQLGGLPYITHTHRNRNKQKYNNLAKYKITYKQIFQQWPITWQDCINSHILPAYSWVLSQRTPVVVDVFSLRDSWKNWFQELIKMNSKTLYIHSSIFALPPAPSTIQIFLLASSIFTVSLGSWSLDTKGIIYCINRFTAQGQFD